MESEHEAYFARTEVVALDYNPEMADMDNPRGAIYGYAAYVYAEDALGNRCRTHVRSSRLESDALEPAKRMALALTVRLTSLGKLPVDFDRWAFNS